MDLLAHPRRHRTAAPAQSHLHGGELCRGANPALLSCARLQHQPSVHQVPLQCRDPGEDRCEPCAAPESEQSEHRQRDGSPGLPEDSQEGRQRLGCDREGRHGDSHRQHPGR